MGSDVADSGSGRAVADRRVPRRPARTARRDRRGEVATYIPELAGVDPDLFGICLATVDGAVYEAGDTRHPFTIQSMSKPLTYGLALELCGPEAVHARVGVEPSGDPFNEISLHPSTGTPLNPMINAGAITCAGLVLEARRRPVRAAAPDVLAPTPAGRSRLDEASTAPRPRPATGTGRSRTCCGASASSPATRRPRSTSTSASVRSRSIAATSR